MASQHTWKHWGERFAVFTGGTLAMAVWAVVAVSILAFMIITVAKLLLEKQAREIIGDSMPKTWHPLAYREKKREDQRVFHLALAVQSEPVGKLDVYGAEGKAYYRTARPSQPYAVMLVAQEGLDELKQPSDRIRRWDPVGVSADCRMFIGNGRPFAFLTRNDPKARQVRTYVRTGFKANPRTSIYEIKKMLLAYCDEMKGAVQPWP